MHVPAWKRSRFAAPVTAITLALSGCATWQPADTRVADAARSSSSARTPALPPAGSGRGGYYMDDGPGDDIPDGLEATPDAEPKIEPHKPRNSRPYVVFGKTYTPMSVNDSRPFKQRGRGSWYGKKFHGQKTSSGELYDMYQMTAAHPTLPLPSYARVTNLKNGRQVIVRVNDRGPFLSNRIIDLSYTAALKLGYIRQGSAELEVERLLPDEIERMASNRHKRTSDSHDVATAALESGALDKAAAPASVRLASVGPATAVSVVNSAGGFYLQLGAYSQKANAESVRDRLAQTWAADLPPLEVAQQGTQHRIFGGPFASRQEAEAAVRRLDLKGAKPMIVQR
jgi:rare lipoprotein A